MTPVEIEVRLQAIKLRRAEIAASLSASKLAFHADGIKRPYCERLALEAEDDALYVEALRLGKIVHEAKIQRHKALNASLLAELQRLLHERGLGALVDEAAERSRVAMAGVAP